MPCGGRSRCPIVFLMSERDGEQGDLLDESVWRRQRQRRVIGPYFLCQRWIERALEAGLLDRCTFVAATGSGRRLRLLGAQWPRRQGGA